VLAIHCRVAKNSLRGTLPRCTAGVAERVLCSSHCRFLTSWQKLSLPRLQGGSLLQLFPGWDHRPLASIPRPGALPSSAGRHSASPFAADEYSASLPSSAGRPSATPASPSASPPSLPAISPSPAESVASLALVWQLYTCGMPSTITAIMRASLCIGSTGPGCCSSPGIPTGLGRGCPPGCGDLAVPLRPRPPLPRPPRPCRGCVGGGLVGILFLGGGISLLGLDNIPHLP